MLLGAAGVSPACINAFCRVHHIYEEVRFVLYCFIRYMLPPSRQFFSNCFSRQMGEAKNSPQDIPSYVGRNYALNTVVTLE